MLADRYELGQEIGRGGMGAVWLARDTLLDRTVAIKKIGTFGGGAPDLERAEREAHLAARVNHQNVVAVFDLVDDDGAQWLVMEHVDGPTLAALVTERGAVGPEEMAPVVEQVAGALAAAHDHGIVHRDVKPSNILLTRGGVAKLSDFGVARAQADASLTQTGLVTGSPAYLSPEVATGKTATSASDVWSLGATIFHALSGHAPYQVEDNVLGTMYRIVNEEPPRLEDSSGHLGALVAAMMQHDPDARPTMLEVQSVAAGEPAATMVSPAVTQAMAAVTTEAEPTPTSAFRPLGAPVVRIPTIPPNQRRLWWAGGAAVALLAIVLFAATVGSGSPAVDVPAATAPASAEKSTPAPTPTATPTPEASPVAEGDAEVSRIEGFATDYLTAASNDPESGFAMLTEKYQKKSGGFEGYNGFWSGVSNLDVVAVQGDAKKETVAYTYSYDYNGERRTEDVVLKLKEKDGSYLIDGTG